MAANARKCPVFVDPANIFAYFVKLTFNAVYLKDRKFGVSFKRNRNDKVNQKSSNMLLKKRRISLKIPSIMKITILDKANGTKIHYL